MAQTSLFKELIKQVSCEAIPNIGFTADDLAKVKSCANKVLPTETIDFNPDLASDQDLLDQSACVAGAAEEAKKIIQAEQRKMPEAIRLSALRGKVQELLDNLTPIQAYYEERYNFFTGVIDGVKPFTAQFLYWSDEYDRLTQEIQAAKDQADTAHNGNSTIKEFIALIYDKSKDPDIQSSSVRTNLVAFTPNFSNISQISQNLGKASYYANFYTYQATTISQSAQITKLLELIKAKVEAYSSRVLAKQNAISAQTARIQQVQSLPANDDTAKNQIETQVRKISSQLEVKFVNGPSTGQPVVPSRTAGFSFRLIDKNQTKVKVTKFNEEGPATDDQGNTIMVEEAVTIFNSPTLSTNLFENIQGLAITGVSLWVEGSGSNSPKSESDYDSLTGFLYNGISGNPYAGLYRKFSKPIKLLFTLEERGLTMNPDLVDPLLKSVKDAPISITEENSTFYVANQATYENFYETLAVEYPKKIQKERTDIYPNTIKPALDELRNLARREAVDVFRADSLSALKLAKPVSYASSSGSSIFSQGTFTYSQTDQALSSKLEYYTRCRTEVTDKIKSCQDEIVRLDALIKANSMDEEVIKSKLLAIPCFSKAGNATQAENSVVGEQDAQPPPGTASTGQESCESKTAKKRATDPLYLRTLSGTDSALPDLTSMCYWKEFTKALNKVCLLPFPDISGPPPQNLGFRYWPISCFIPIPPGMVLLPIPPRWKTLFVLPTPLGTMVCFLTMPIAPIGIPLPSIYIYFFAIDGNKYLVFAPNVPILYSPTSNIKFGFIQDNSAASINPLGLSPTNPNKGQPMKGALTVPLAVTALTSKAKRLTSLAAMAASGAPSISNLAGQKLPVDIKFSDLLNGLPSEAETMLSIANAAPNKDFSRQMAELKKSINRQLDKLGNMQIPAIIALKQQLAAKKETEEAKAFKETNNYTRRINRKKARSLKLTSTKDKINATKLSINSHIDNIKLGTIKYPKDPTKFLAELPSPIPAIIDIIEMAAAGDFKVDASATDLRIQLSRVISKIDLKKLSAKKKFDLKKPEDLAEFKSALKKLTGQTTKYLKGQNVNISTAAAKTKEEADEIVAAEKAVQDKLAKAISLTAAALAVPVTLNIFDFGKKCCEVQAQNALSTVPIPVNLAFTLITALLESLIDALTPNAIMKTLGIKTPKVDLDIIGDLLDKIISSIPKVPLPDPASLQIMIMALIIPILSIISLPKAIPEIRPIGPPIPLIIPLDPLLKPLIKKTVGDIVDGVFNLLDKAGNSVLAAEAEAKAAAENGQNSGTGQAQTGQGTPTGQTGGANPTATDSAKRALKDRQFVGNSEAGMKVLNRAFSTACGDTGITASLNIQSKIEINKNLVTVNDAAAIASAQNQTAATFEKTANSSKQIVEDVEVTSSSTAVISLKMPNGETITLPELPFFALDIGGNFELMSGADIIEMLRSIVNTVFDKFIKPIETIVTIILTIARSLNTFSYTVIESGIPQIKIIKLIIMAIDALIPPGFKMKSINLDAMKIIENTLIKGLLTVEPVLKEIAWIGSLVACAFGNPASLYSTIKIARLFHPIMNQDDLPPWERLTHKNPLFAIFLDEIAWRGSIYATGSLIFQTKTPAVLPYSPIFPIVHIPIHTLSP